MKKNKNLTVIILTSAALFIFFAFVGVGLLMSYFANSNSKSNGDLLGETNTNTYFVDKNSIGGTCSDLNPGTLSAPFCNINKAIGVVVAGDTIYLRSATYPAFEIQKSGNASAYITITNYNDENVIINANQTASQAVSIRNASYVKIKGLKVTGAVGNYDGGIRVQGGQGNVIEGNESYSNRGINTHGIIVYDSSNTTIANNKVYDNYLSGIAVTDSSASGTIMTGNIIINNQSYNNTNTTSPGNADGIKLSGVNHTGALIKENVVYGNGDDGIDTWISHNHTVERNTIYNQTLAGDGNGIKVGGGTTGGNNLVRFNIVYNNKANGITANGSGGNRFYHNVAYKNGKHGIEDSWKQVACTTLECKSIVIGNIGFDNTVSNLSANVDTGEAHNNIWFDSASGTAKIGYNYIIKNTLNDFFTASGNRLESTSDTSKSSLVANPLFVDVSVFNFHLQNISPAIDRGDIGNPAQIVINGNAPDIGAFEFGTGTTPPPPPVVEPDTTAPVVTVTNPANNAAIRRNTTVTIVADATDNVGLAKVEFYVNGKLLCTDVTGPYGCAWKAAKAGNYTLLAKAYDPSNNSTSSSIVVSVK